LTVERFTTFFGIDGDSPSSFALAVPLLSLVAVPRQSSLGGVLPPVLFLGQCSFVGSRFLKNLAALSVVPVVG